MLGSDIIKPHLKKSYKDFLKTIYTFPSQSWTKRKNQIKFLFSHFFVVSQKVLKSFIKPFEAPQRSVKIKKLTYFKRR